VQHTTGAAQGERDPRQFVLVCASGHTCGEKQVLLAEVFDAFAECACSSEGFKKQAHGFLDLFVGVEHHMLGRIVDETGGEPAAQFAAACLVEETSAQTRPKHVEFGFTHGPLETE